MKFISKVLQWRFSQPCVHTVRPQPNATSATSCSAVMTTRTTIQVKRWIKKMNSITNHSSCQTALLLTYCCSLATWQPPTRIIWLTTSSSSCSKRNLVTGPFPPCRVLPWWLLPWVRGYPICSRCSCLEVAHPISQQRQSISRTRLSS